MYSNPDYLHRSSLTSIGLASIPTLLLLAWHPSHLAPQSDSFLARF